MLNQFHDVIPGTSIRMANQDAWAIYDARSSETEDLIQQALNVLLTGDESQKSPGPLVLDPLRLARQEVVESTSVGHGQSATEVAHLWIETDESGIGHVTDLPTSMVSPTATVTGDRAVLENSHFRFVISEGRVTSLVDVQLERELIAPGPGASNAGLMLYDDFPLAYDAWDAEIYHLDQCREIKFTTLEVGVQDKLRASIRATAKFGVSTVILTVRHLTRNRRGRMLICPQFSLDAASPTQTARSHVQVQVHADWHEKHRFLKCESMPHRDDHADE